MLRAPTICLNGHIISRSTPDAAPFCPQCGGPTYSKCAECGEAIPGMLNLSAKRPNYCVHCRAAYPWTKLALNNAVELAALDDGLSEDDRELIRNAIPGLLTDGPTMPLSAAKYRKGMSKAGDFLKNSMQDLLKDFMSDAAKKLLFPTL